MISVKIVYQKTQIVIYKLQKTLSFFALDSASTKQYDASLNTAYFIPCFIKTSNQP